jgi:hypothetical protein
MTTPDTLADSTVPKTDGIGRRGRIRRRTRIVVFRLTEAEYEQIMQEAAGESVSIFARAKILGPVGENRLLVEMNEKLNEIRELVRL